MTANIMAVAVLVWFAGNLAYVAAQAVNKNGGAFGFVVGAMGLVISVICAVIHLASRLTWVR